MGTLYIYILFIFQRLICNTNKHEFSSIRIWISCFNDVMNRVECVFKRDVYPQKMHACSKYIRGISFKKHPWYIKKKYIAGVIACVLYER